ncbi:hypothetical protein HanHA300_Chr10g0359401 [Helianthus annuus]|nr:hypothetical protein HanHA300_Chr10g0359401 [Helianthus annuus]KAJ0521461.1 hypothetical protein HanIR_Chr10g0471131 [Helianthus annuus]KAJ0529703.1 hypothetical protein HanHA89_Chr10g0381001 [Helianthus annuus]KAJ0696574.1 hypothetical protein HanLR1_Chr10g0358721 [Helianthus annuus]
MSTLSLPEDIVDIEEVVGGVPPIKWTDLHLSRLYMAPDSWIFGERRIHLKVRLQPMLRSITLPCTPFSSTPVTFDYRRPTSLGNY